MECLSEGITTLLNNITKHEYWSYLKRKHILRRPFRFNIIIVILDFLWKGQAVNLQTKKLNTALQTGVLG